MKITKKICRPYFVLTFLLLALSLSCFSAQAAEPAEEQSAGEQATEKQTEQERTAGGQTTEELTEQDQSAGGQPAEEQVQVLRVGFFAFPGYHIIEEDGRRSGYGYEFLQRLAIHAGWSYEYVGYDGSYADSLDMLRSGEADIVTSVSKTAEREKEFLFSDQDIGVNSTILTVKSGNQDIMEGDYDTYDGITVGMLDGNSKNANFERFADEHGFTFRPVYFAGQDELSAALQAGEVDASVTGSLRLLENEWLLESFDASPFYICTRKDRTDLMEQINAAINDMDLHEPNWRDTLHETYYSTDQTGSPGGSS